MSYNRTGKEVMMTLKFISKEQLLEAYAPKFENEANQFCKKYMIDHCKVHFAEAEDPREMKHEVCLRLDENIVTPCRDLLSKPYIEHTLKFLDE